MAELKPCPFCGGKAKTHKPDPEVDPQWYITCPNYDECCTPTAAGMTYEEAAAIWNRRVDDPVKERLLGALAALPLDIVDHCCGRCPSLEKCTNPEFKPQCSIADVMELANELREAWEGETDAD
jgi:hypothetical protein